MTASSPIVPAGEARLEAILDLNNRHASELSWLENDELARLMAGAFYCRVIGNVDAFLMSFDQNAEYESPNFQWFCARYPRFVYVDRVVVDPAARGRGYAWCLYQELFNVARSEGHEVVTAEVNAVPPNPASDAFHAAMGFAPVGEAAIHGGTKTVRYFALEL